MMRLSQPSMERHEGNDAPPAPYAGSIQHARFEHLEGLRAYLALWVVVSHALEFTLIRSKLGPFGNLLNGGYAVQGFMILSGFVITHLMIAKHEPYNVYIIRRFLRLMPIFVLCMALSWITYDWLIHAATHLPWSDDPAFAEFGEKYLRRQAQMAEHPVAHALAHFFMVHGAIPEEILPGASGTILAPGWSISLEWQFYLVAPLVFLLFQRGTLGWLVIFSGILGGVVLFKVGVFGTVGSAFLGISAKFLVLGMVFRLALPALAQINIPLWPAMIAIITFILMIFEEPLGFLPWAVALLFVLQGLQGKEAKLGKILFASQPVLAVGRVSYSIYLIHFVVQQVTVFWVIQYYPNISQFALLVILLAMVPVVVGVSFLLYRAVERPGIVIGHLVGRRLLNH